MRGDRPNILMISIDTLRPDHLGMFGYGIDTSPFLDKRAGESVLFENAIARPSMDGRRRMFSIFTSLYPTVHGVDRRVERSMRTLPPESKHLRKYSGITNTGRRHSLTLRRQ